MTRANARSQRGLPIAAEIFRAIVGRLTWNSRRRGSCRPPHIRDSGTVISLVRPGLQCYYMTREQCEEAVDYHGFCVANSNVPTLNNEAPQRPLRRRRRI
jgi:hypothetical protein